MRPDLVWESKMGGCKIAENLQETSRLRFKELNNNPLEELKDTIERCKIDIPVELPPMIAGLFGYVSYDVIRLIENLPHVNNDELGVPDIRLIRPTILIVLDATINSFFIESSTIRTVGRINRISGTPSSSLFILGKFSISLITS